MALGLVGEVPFLGQRIGHLPHLNDVKRLFKEKQPVTVAKPPDEIVPGKIRMTRANDDLQIEAFLPDMTDGFDAIPAGRHANVHKGHRIWLAVRERFPHTSQTLLALKCRVYLKRGKAFLKRPFAGQSRVSARE